MTWMTSDKPPVIRGKVPDGYRGPLFYKWHVFTYEGLRASLQEQIVLEDRAMADRLVQKPSHTMVALRKDQNICDANGDLHPALREPIKARIRTKAYKSWPEITCGQMFLVSPRVRDVIEEFAPGAHYFIAIDVADRQGGSFRTYAFFCGVMRDYPALALKANNIPYTIDAATGRPDYIAPVWAVNSEQFGYLNASVIGGAPLLWDMRVMMLFSPELVARLGDVLPKHMCFVPMGLVEEPWT